jgi:hypothetical protein
MSQAARERVKVFTWERILDQLWHFYKNVVVIREEPGSR